MHIEQTFETFTVNSRVDDNINDRIKEGWEIKTMLNVIDVDGTHKIAILFLRLKK